MKIVLYHNSKAADFSFDPAVGDKTAFLAEAKKAAEKLHGAPLAGQALLVFEDNVSRWMKEGFEGHFSLKKALETPAVKGLSLVDVQMVGTEIELGLAGVRKPDIEYGAKLADTAQVATVKELAASGVSDRATSWPLMSLTTDGVSKKQPDKGHIEVVFGPVALSDHKELERRGRATELLQRALYEQTAFGPEVRRPKNLGEAITRYNKLLTAEKDPALHKYQLRVKDDVGLAVPAMPSPSVQTNVEIPLRKLGDPSDTTVLALFGAKESADKEMFIKAREEAGKIVDTMLRPTASALHGDRYDPASIKLDKLRGTLTLALMYLGKIDAFDKAHWPFLPKTGAGDIVRTALNLRDKLTLHHHTSGNYAAFEKAMLEGAQAVHSAPGGEIKALDPVELKEQIESILKPGARPKRWGIEATCYGTLLDPKKQAWSTGTSTGKPLPVGFDYTQKLLTSAEPKVVVELRRSDNPVSATFENLSKVTPLQPKLAKTALEKHDTYKHLKEAATHVRDRPAKTEKSPSIVH
ncbi:MAG: hypothetical protein U1E65_20760 [Myxococcota bacterium]